MLKVRSLTKLCGLRVAVESYVAQKAHCNASASATRSGNADTHPGASLVGASTSQVDALTRGSSLSAVIAGETTQRTTVAA